MSRNWGVFKRNCSELKSVPGSRYEEVPAEMRDYVKMLLSTAPDLRPTTEQIQQLPYFEDFGVKTLTNLDSQFQWDNLQKSQFYKVQGAVIIHNIVSLSEKHCTVKFGFCDIFGGVAKLSQLTISDLS